MIPPPLNHKSRIVVAVDDQPENLMLLRAIVEHHGDTFFGATSGPEGISLATRTSPRLILLDVQMPGMDGFETCRRMRQLWALRQTPIAFLTACKTGQDVQEGIRAGGNDFLMKPFDPDKLLARIDHWTSRRLAVA
jgi:CheY-like chemotaxis protein